MIGPEQFEKSRLDLQARFDAGKTQAERNRLGQFATPSQLASEIIAYALSLLSSRPQIRFLEPGFGTGPFYSALLRQVTASRIEIAVGYEIDPYYADPAQGLWRGTGLRLHMEDFTKAEPPKSEAARYDLIACNPPYVRHHHLSQTQKRELQAALARYLNFEMNGLSGLYTYFLVFSQAWMARAGIGAWLIPSEFMDVNYGRKVKEFLLKKVTLHRIHRFDPKEVQFGDALVSSAVVFFRNCSPPRTHKVEFTFGGTLNNPKVSESVGVDDLKQIAKWTSVPEVVARPVRQRDGVTLGDLFTIKRGLATGCKSFFVLTPVQVQQLSLPKKFLEPILPSPREVGTDEILADKDGEPQIASRRYLLSCNLPESEVKSRYRALWKYLESGIEKGLHERYLCRHRQPWYSQENRPPAPFLCTYMGRPTRRSESPFRFILNYSKATAANVYLVLYPKPILAACLNDDPELQRAVWKALSSITAEMLMGEGRMYGGGLHKLEPNELANVAADVILKVLPGAKQVRRSKQLDLFAI
ncbi:MAG: Eco57I restriction-modification methylase domain-containing protein [Deltaproteobacteria bacterium]|nr:Eco57I restriction-modification methylase domain-containing protein [Deltaproteobacteria bacterium]